MVWFRYVISSGELLGASVTQWPTLKISQDQVEDPTDNRTEVQNPPPGKFWIYTGSELRDATAPEIAGFPAFRAADEEAATKVQAEESVDNDEANGKVIRAIAFTAMDEINLLRLKVNEILDAIDGASNFAGVKSAIAAITDLAPRTEPQMKTAIKGKISSGEV